MSQAKFIENFLSVTDFQNPVEISMDAQPESLSEWDSLAAFEVIVMFDIEYGKTIASEDLIKTRTVGDLYQMLGL